MAPIARSLVLLAVAPLGGVAVGLYAEFSPAAYDISWSWGIIAFALLLSLLLASLLATTRVNHRTATAVLAGGTIGAATFGLAEGVYVAAHLARGGFLNFEAFDSQREMAVGLILYYSATGAAVGLATGLAVSIVLAAGSLIASKRPRGAGGH